MLKHLHLHPNTYLTTLYNRILQSGSYPSNWAIVILILKPSSDASAPQSYHPISLISVLAKTFEIWRKYEGICRNMKEIRGNMKDIWRIQGQYRRKYEEIWVFRQQAVFEGGGSSEFFLVPEIWRYMKKIWRNMKENEEIWRKYEEISSLEFTKNR